MDFFEHQTQARKNTRRLVIYFIIAVISILLLINTIGMIIFNLAQHPGRGSHGSRDVPVATPQIVWFDPMTVAICTGITALLIGGGSLYKMAELAAGGKAVARMLGGRPLSGDSADRDERKLLNVVEEMSIASGVPVPPVYLLDEEMAINAFAAGRSPRDCVIGVTRGCMERLSRDELQGVIAHEFSHILNGDMKLNLRLIGLLHGLLVLGITGYVLMRTAGTVGRGSRKNGAQAAIALFLIGLAVMIIGFIGVFFGNLIKAAVSRQREFLADASAVQFTRNPGGIGGALRKLMGVGSKVGNPRCVEASHMMFGSVVMTSLGGLLATHPPLKERIKRIDAGLLDGVEADATGGAGLVGAAAAGAAGFAGATTTAAAARPETTVSREQLFSGMDGVGARHMDFGAAVMADLDPRLVDAARNPFSARAVVYALLLGKDQEERRIQLSLLSERADRAVLPELKQVYPLVAELPLAERLPVLGLCMAALTRLTPDQHEHFMGIVDGLILADDQITLFEYALRRMILHHLRPVSPTPGKATGDDLKVLLSAMAYCGADTARAAVDAFLLGTARLKLPAKPADLLPPSACGWEPLDGALDRLARGTPANKRRLLEACADIVAADGEIRLEEGELIRAVADSLDCPMPPLVV